MGAPFSTGEAALMVFAFLGWVVIDPVFRPRVDALMRQRRNDHNDREQRGEDDQDRS